MITSDDGAGSSAISGVVMVIEVVARSDCHCPVFYRVVPVAVVAEIKAAMARLPTMVATKWWWGIATWLPSPA